MGLIDDPISGLVGVFFKRALDSKIGQRVELLLELFIASQIAFLVACGTALLAGSVKVAIGTGMLAAAISLLATFCASPNSRGLIISLPQQAMQQEMATPMTTIERNQK